MRKVMFCLWAIAGRQFCNIDVLHTVFKQFVPKGPNIRNVLLEAVNRGLIVVFLSNFFFSIIFRQVIDRCDRFTIKVYIQKPINF